MNDSKSRGNNEIVYVTLDCISDEAGQLSDFIIFLCVRYFLSKRGMQLQSDTARRMWCIIGWQIYWFFHLSCLHVWRLPAANPTSSTQTILIVLFISLFYRSMWMPNVRRRCDWMRCQRCLHTKSNKFIMQHIIRRVENRTKEKNTIR